MRATPLRSGFHIVVLKGCMHVLHHIADLHSPLYVYKITKQEISNKQLQGVHAELSIEMYSSRAPIIH